MVGGPDPCVKEVDLCERCHGLIGMDEERHLCYGAIWCASCHDNHYPEGD